MALNLQASQQDLKGIFGTGDRFIIPSYQRPYSWEYDQCSQLFSDIVEAFEGRKEFFVGNILMAKSPVEKNRPRVVDGQQRLLTIWLMFKVMYLLYPGLNDLKKVVAVPAREGDKTYPKIVSEVFETDDPKDIPYIHEMTLQQLEMEYNNALDKKGNIREDIIKSRIKINLFYLYNWILAKRNEYDDEKMKDFIFFVLDNVSVLPIELTGTDMEDASDRALVIFETLNNRGMDLEDADIFKERLYRKAVSVKEKDMFIQNWTDLKSLVEDVGMTIDDIFRYYSHIIRGRNNITYGEKSLRQFFLLEKFSPLQNKEYKDILDDLNKMVWVLKFLTTSASQQNELGKWMQIINAYTNQYPKYVLATYLFEYGWENIIKDSSQFIELIKALIRYCYFMGSTTTVKFRMYEYIKQITHKQEIGENRISDLNITRFDWVGTLRKGYALLAYYLTTKELLSSYSIDQVYTQNDVKRYAPDQQEEYQEMLNCLGNMVVLDINRRSLSCDKKANYYLNSGILEVRQLLDGSIRVNKDLIMKRNEEIKKRLYDFFSV
jgi:uncharacterized protein with ParB-like and HNH nuclease domain